MKLSIDGSNFNSMFVIISELKFSLLMGGLGSKAQYCGTCKISWKNSKTLQLDCSSYNEGDIMQNHEQMKKWKKVKDQDSMGKKIFFFLAPGLQPLGNLSHMASFTSSLEIIGKMSLRPYLNKPAPRAHTKSEFDVLGIHSKLEKYIIHLSNGIIYILYTICPNCNWPIFGLKEF